MFRGPDGFKFRDSICIILKFLSNTFNPFKPINGKLSSVCVWVIILLNILSVFFVFLYLSNRIKTKNMSIIFGYEPGSKLHSTTSKCIYKCRCNSGQLPAYLDHVKQRLNHLWNKLATLVLFQDMLDNNYCIC